MNKNYYILRLQFLIVLIAVHVSLWAQTFTDSGIYLVGGGPSWGDYDNDGYLDVLSSNKIYHNNGDYTFTSQDGINLPSESGHFRWSDYDGDGDLDLFVTGTDISGNRVAKIYKNSGIDGFNELTSSTLPTVMEERVHWVDYDNDGDLDFLLTGDTGSGCISKMFRNDDNKKFTEMSDISMTGVFFSSVSWGDYNNDGYLDLLLIGDSIPPLF